MMKLMNIRNFCALVSAVSLVSAAGGADEESSLWGWSVSGGANFGFGLKSDLQVSPVNAMRNMPNRTISVGPTRKAAAAASKPVAGGSRVNYGNGYYIDPSSSWGDTPGNESETWNWKLPDSAVVGEGAGRHFEMDGAEWGEVVSQVQDVRNLTADDSSGAYGASVELCHGLWMSEDAKWGVDFAFGVSWLKSIDCFKASGVAARRSATVENGDSTVNIPGEFFASKYARAEDDGTWGNGTYNGDDPSRDQYLIDLDRITTSTRTLGSSGYSDSMTISARGDYEELELSGLLRPWYDVNDWLCVHAALGLGVTRSSFQYWLDAYSSGSTIYQSSEEFSEWRCYGIAGGGLLFRIWDFDLSCDGLFRWCQRDMDINGRDVHGSIEKPWAVVRVGLSYAF